MSEGLERPMLNQIQWQMKKNYYKAEKTIHSKKTFRQGFVKLSCQNFLILFKFIKREA